MTEDSDIVRPPVVIDRRRFLLTALGGAGAIVVGACSGGSGSGPGQAESVGPGQDPESLTPLPRPTVRMMHGAFGFPTPFASNGGPGYNQMTLLYDTLLWKDGTGELLPWLAKRFDSSDDHLRYTFEVRDDVKWSDGQRLTADDVVFTFEYYAQQESLPPPVIIQPPQGISKVARTGDNGVEIVLERPLVTFLEHIPGALPIVPRHVWSSIRDAGSALDRKVVVGSGPYRLESYKEDGGPLLFTARDDYFLGAPFVKRVEMNNVSEPFTALLSGGVDVARGFGLRDDILAPFSADGEYGMITEQGAWINGALYWNLGRGGALADVRFRQACAMAIDRQDLVTRLASGRGLPGNPGFLSPKNPFYVPVREYPLDVAGANALLDGAGYRPGPGGVRRGPDGGALSFELRIDHFEAPLSEILVASLRRIGVELRPKPVQIGPELFGAKFFGGYDMVVLPFPGPVAGGPNADPDVLRHLFSSRVPPSLTAASNYVNPRFDDLADRQLVTFDREERKAMVAEMQRIVADDIPILPLYSPDTTVVFRKRVLDQWYFTPGQYPTSEDNKQLFITGLKTGTRIRPAK
jgi:peptide/nickel transport system substrate-binding protein